MAWLLVVEVGITLETLHLHRPGSWSPPAVETPGNLLWAFIRDFPAAQRTPHSLSESRQGFKRIQDQHKTSKLEDLGTRTQAIICTCGNSYDSIMLLLFLRWVWCFYSPQLSGLGPWQASHRYCLYLEVIRTGHANPILCARHSSKLFTCLNRLNPHLELTR